MHREQIDAALAARLVAEQFPSWAGLALVPVEEEGWDNRTFRLGESLSIRLPSGPGYVASVEKEQTWLPRLAPQLPLPIPEPVALGRASAEYPWAWSVRRWIEGRPAGPDTIGDPPAFARDLAGFLTALQRIPADGGPVAGAHCFHRGAPPAFYDAETRAALATLGPRVDGRTAAAVWDAALDARWVGTPTWFHGDVAAGNLLVDRDGRLTAVIDFGTCGVGDPACDLVVSWTLLDGPGRAAFRSLMPADEAMWARARGWALWKALITLAASDVQPDVAVRQHHLVDAVLAD